MSENREKGLSLRGEVTNELNKLVQEPELKKYPYSYNPIVIEKSTDKILSLVVEKIEKSLVLRLLLRSVYLKGHQDGHMKTSDMSWEDKVIADICKEMR
jgi:hypothetical protein